MYIYIYIYTHTHIVKRYFNLRRTSIGIEEFHDNERSNPLLYWNLVGIDIWMKIKTLTLLERFMAL